MNQTVMTVMTVIAVLGGIAGLFGLALGILWLVIRSGRRVHRNAQQIKRSDLNVPTSRRLSAEQARTMGDQIKFLNASREAEGVNDDSA